MYLKVLANGSTGTGKSYFGLGFPKVAWLLTEPGNLVLLETHPHLKQNVVWAEEFIPSPIEDIKITFERLQKAILRAYTECKEGKIDTLFLDNVDKKQNLFLVDKDRTGMFKNEIIVPDEKFGKRLTDWAMEGVGDIYIPRTQSSPRAKELIEKITSAKELLISDVFNSVKNVVFGEIKFNNSNDIRKLTKLRQALAQKYKNPKNRI